MRVLRSNMTPWPIRDVHQTMTIMRTKARTAMRIEIPAIHSIPWPAVRSIPKRRKARSTPFAAASAPVLSFVRTRSIAAAVRSGPESWTRDSRRRTTSEPPA